jgi:hypothetical protein
MFRRTYTVASGGSTSHNKYRQVPPDSTPAATPTVNGSSATALPFSTDETPSIDSTTATADAATADTQQQQSSSLEISALPLYRACLEGYLMLHEYTIITACIAYVVLTLTFGSVLTVVHPHWFGHIVWCSMLIVAITALTAAKYIETRAIDRKMACNIVLVRTAVNSTAHSSASWIALQWSAKLSQLQTPCICIRTDCTDMLCWLSQLAIIT